MNGRRDPSACSISPLNGRRDPSACSISPLNGRRDPSACSISLFKAALLQLCDEAFFTVFKVSFVFHLLCLVSFYNIVNTFLYGKCSLKLYMLYNLYHV